MSQGNLFDAPNVYGELAPAQRHSQTSLDAAESITPALNALQKELLAYFVVMGKGGATDEEAANDLGWNPSTLRPRRVELHRAGLIKDSGSRRNTMAGRKAVIWVVV